MLRIGLVSRPEREFIETGKVKLSEFLNERTEDKGEK